MTDLKVWHHGGTPAPAVVPMDQPGSLVVWNERTREVYAVTPINQPDEENTMTDLSPGLTIPESPGRWWSDRDLAAHDREVAAEALREAGAVADDATVKVELCGHESYESGFVQGRASGRSSVAEYLRSRADRIEAGE